MDISNPVPGILAILYALTVSAIIVRRSAFYTEETGSSNGGRYETIDGLRGYLAFGVFLTHAVLFYHWYQTGEWGGVSAGMYSHTGGYGVALFFEITGFLFWGKLLRANGRVDWKQLFLSRIKRLTPLYLFSVMLVLTVVAVKSDFELQVGLRSLARQIGTWLTFSLIEPANINGVASTERINAGVLWTLAYEWKFYLALPLLAFFIPKWNFRILTIAVLAFVLFNPSELVIIHFLFGMITAYIVSTKEWRVALSRPIFSLVIIGITAVLFVFPSYIPAVIRALLLFFIFLMIAHGNSLFGILQLRASKYLGTVSYSLYLLHGIILYVGLALLNHVRPIKELSLIEYWSWLLLAITTLVIFCGFTFRYIENPFLRKRKSPVTSRHTIVGFKKELPVKVSE